MRNSEAEDPVKKKKKKKTTTKHAQTSDPQKVWN